MPVTHRFIAALAESMIPIDEIELTTDERQAIIQETSDFVIGQVEALPRRLALMFAIGTAFFRFYVRITRFRGFCDLKPEMRREILDSWAYGSIPLFRALFKLIRSTALLTFFESPAVQSALDRSNESVPAEEVVAS